MSHHSFTFSNYTFGNNLYIPPPNFSIPSGPQTRVSSKQEEQLNFQPNLNNAAAFIFYPFQGNNNEQVAKNSNNSLIKGLLPNNQREMDIFNNQSNNYYEAIPEPEEYATVTKIPQNPSAHHSFNYAPANLSNNNFPYSQTCNYITSIINETNNSVPGLNKYESLPQKTNNATFPPYNNCVSNYPNSQSFINYSLPPQGIENNALIQTDYNFQISNAEMINEDLVEKNLQINSNEGLFSQLHNQSSNYQTNSQNQIHIYNIDSLYQFQGNTNINLNSSTENQLNPNESEINIPNERNQNYDSNGLDVNGENGYSFNQMNNKLISMNNRLDEHIIKQNNLNEWFRKHVERQEKFNEEQEAINQELKDLNKRFFAWMQKQFPEKKP